AHRRANDHGRRRRFHRHWTSPGHRCRYRTSRSRRHPQLRPRRLHQLDGRARPRRTSQRSSRRRFLRRLRRPLPQPLGRIHFPRRLLARHCRLHRSRDGRLRHLHATLVSASACSRLGLRFFRLPSIHEFPRRSQLWTLRILVRDDQGRCNRHLHRARRVPAPHRTSRSPIHRPRGIFSPRPRRPAPRPHFCHLYLRRRGIHSRNFWRIHLPHRRRPRRAHDFSHSHLPLSGRHHHPRRRHALESRRCRREPVRHRLPFRQPPRRRSFHEFRGLDRRSLRRQCCALHLVPHDLLASPHRVGSRRARAP